MTTYLAEDRMVQRMSVLFVGPVLGLAYVICMPFLAVATILTLMTAMAVSRLASLARTLATFGWRPSEAYLSGKKRKRYTR